MKIYDCFSFFNELDLLEIRLNELDAVVDVFVLVEATWTHQKKSKPLYFQENKDRFKKFEKKIRHVILHDHPDFFYGFRKPTVWDYERFQKDQIRRGLTDCKPNDQIILSDVDEIPKSSILNQLRDKPGIKIFQQRVFHYFLNCLQVEKSNPNNPFWWYGSVMTDFKNFTSGKKLRFLREVDKYKGNTIIPDAGWHFTSLGGVEKIILKIESFGHSEFNKPDYKNPKRIKDLIENGKSVFGADIQCLFKEIDESFPQYIRFNQANLKEFIFKNNVTTLHE